jgi:hypothetical protein
MFEYVSECRFSTKFKCLETVELNVYIRTLPNHGPNFFDSYFCSINSKLSVYKNLKDAPALLEQHTVILFCWQFVLVLVLQSLAFSARQNT